MTRSSIPANNVQRSSDEKMQMYEGASISELAQMFEMDRRSVSLRMKDCVPSGTRAGAAVYKIKDAAAYLVEPRVDIEAWIKKLRPNDLPPYLQHDFWRAQKARLEYERAMGDLWQTEGIKIVLADTLRRLRDPLLMMDDMIDKEVGLTKEQRAIVHRTVDSVLEEIFEALQRPDPNLLDHYNDDLDKPVEKPLPNSL